MKTVTHLWRSRITVGMLALSVGLISSCSGPAEPNPGTVATPPEAGHIAYAPTAEDELPPAILGQAPAPQGTNLQYLEDDPSTNGYLALPAGEGSHPALILVHEWDGLNDRVRQVADAFAAEGYVALAADLYQGRTGSNPEENMALVNETMAQPQRVIQNLNAAAATLRNHPAVSGRIAVMGWCFGGGVALSYGLDGEEHDGTAMFYGRLVQDPEQLAKLNHPIYGTFASEDTGIPPADVERFVEALRTAGIENDVHIYDDVNHGFWLWVDQVPARTEAALGAWQRLKAYLNRVLG